MSLRKCLRVPWAQGSARDLLSEWKSAVACYYSLVHLYSVSS